MSDDPLIRPIGFGIVSDGVYRSAYPTRMCYDYVRGLKLKSMIALNPSELRDDLRTFAAVEHIKLFEFDVGQNIEPFVTMDLHKVKLAVEAAQDEENKPCIIFCNTGCIRTCCIVGCIRRREHWSLASITAEFDRFANREGGVMDVQFIENFE